MTRLATSYLLPLPSTCRGIMEARKYPGTPFCISWSFPGVLHPSVSFPFSQTRIVGQGELLKTIRAYEIEIPSLYIVNVVHYISARVDCFWAHLWLGDVAGTIRSRTLSYRTGSGVAL